jgi:histidinol-phosphate aminotransferase
VDPGRVIVGNGSDELLAMAVRAFAEPRRDTVQWFVPSYSLYPVLAATHGARSGWAPLREDFSLPTAAELRRVRTWRSDAALTIVTTPNAPSGRYYSPAELETLCRSLRGVVILDEAYVDFAPGDAMGLASKLPNVIVARTFSKGYSLCFQRVGYFVGPAALIGALQKIRDSYNVNGLGQIAAAATLDALPYYRKNFRRVIATRERLARGLAELGFEVRPSATNFLLARPPGAPAKAWLQRLRERKLLVRWFDLPEVRAYLRITVGTDAEADALLKAARELA